MAKSKNYVYTNLSENDSLYLEIEGVRYDITQHNDSFAINEIPICQCVVGVGRDLTSDGATKKAAVHQNNKYKQMTKAKVVFEPREEYSLDAEWPKGGVTIFEGYLLGFVPRKMRGKYQVVANLVHWLIDLTCSSCLTAAGHFTNPTQLNVAAILPSGSGTNNRGAYEKIGQWASIVEPVVAVDVWAAIKTVFCKMANSPTLAIVPNSPCGGSGDMKINKRALDALSRIEGGDGECAFKPSDGGETYSVPLALKSISEIMKKSVSDGIASEMLGHYANVSFWDKLVGQFCPQFGMALVPMADRALVIADLPTYRGNVWKDVSPEEYDSLDISPLLEQPLRGVGVTASYIVETQGGLESISDAPPTIGGCYVEQSVSEGDGVLRIVPPPAWLNGRYAFLNGGGGPDGTREDASGRFVGCDAGAGTGKSDVFSSDDVKLYSDYAQMVYASSVLRGRTGMLSGHLRFDIAPGSIIRLTQKSEEQMEGEDELAASYIACVARVNNSISAEGPRAGTVLQLTHVRREDPENKEDRTSVAEHPLFGKSIHGGGKHGAPLVPKYDL